MDSLEKARRLAALGDLFLTYGVEASPERIKQYGNATQFIPIQVYRQACLNAVSATPGSWPPGPGDIVRAAAILAPGERSPSHGASMPKWLQRQLGYTKRQEQPKQIGQRTGPPVIGEGSR